MILKNKNQYWANWNKSQICKPINIFYPENKEQLINLIKDLNKTKRSIHAYGSSHSWSNIVCADYLINTDKLNKVISIDMHNYKIKVEAGIKIYDLNKVLAENNLALQNMGETTAQSAAGLIATATHGSGKLTGTTSNLVLEIEIIDANGKIHIFSHDNNIQDLAAAKTHIGALGIIYSVTFECVPLFKLKHSRIVSNWEFLKNNYQNLYNNNDYFMFYLNPYSKKALYFIWNNTDQDITKSENFLISILDKLLIGRITQKLWYRIIKIFPNLSTKFFDYYYSLAQRTNEIDYGYKLLADFKESNHKVKYHEIEIAVPYEYLLNATQDLFNILEKYKKRNYKIWQILFRFCEPDKNNYLSMASGRKNCYLSITSAEIIHDLYKEIQDTMLKYKGRPHWGKINFLDYDIAKELYGQNLDNFIAVRNKLDPNNIFANNFVKTVFMKD